MTWPASTRPQSPPITLPWMKPSIPTEKNQFSITSKNISSPSSKNLSSSPWLPLQKTLEHSWRREYGLPSRRHALSTKKSSIWCLVFHRPARPKRSYESWLKNIHNSGQSWRKTVWSRSNRLRQPFDRKFSVSQGLWTDQLYAGAT